MRKKAVSPAGHIRRAGVKIHGGPWTIFSVAGTESAGRLIVALGRNAGGAVVRSRIRRIARDEHTKAHADLQGVDYLLAARSDVSDVPRSRLRVAIADLFRRGHEALARRRTA